MIRRFEARNPGVSIEFQTFKPTEYNTALPAAMQAGKGPDIVHLRAYGALQPFARPEFLVPLDDKVPELKTFPRQWLDGARSRADHRVYGVPFAGLTLAAAPVLALYVLMSRQFIRGLTAGAVKG
jgi:raffinose/stachyose/melibiose transport system substrate-binding protein